MKIKQIIISGLLLSGLAVLIAGMELPAYETYRTLNGIERAVFGHPTTEKGRSKKVCYLETREAKGLNSATSGGDPYFSEFKVGGLFEQLYEENSVFTLVQEFVANFNKLKRPQDLIYLWFIRKNFAEKCDFSNKPGTAHNLFLFYTAYEPLFETIKKAENWAKDEGGTSLGCIGAGCEDYARTAFTCIDDPDGVCLDYPTCFACSI
ncbi:MAG: hypothetical protein ACSW8C_00855 [bacterium]